MRSARDLDPAETRAWMERTFDVDPASGRLVWKVSPKMHPRMLGKEAGAPRSSRKPYWYVKRDTLPIKRSWLVWLWAQHKWPDEMLDHIDGNSLNDRADNLREATTYQNAWNHKRRSRRINLPMGVRSMPSGRFEARISHMKTQHHLGSYATPAEAEAAYRAKRQELFHEFA